MTSSSSSRSTLQPSAGARRYFRQFLGEPVPLVGVEASIVSAVEALDKEGLSRLGEVAYQAVLKREKGSDGAVDLIPDAPALAPPDVFMAFYIAMVNYVADELDIESPVQVRNERGLSPGDTLPGLSHDHLVLVARFSLDVLQGQRLPDSFNGLADLVAERLASLVELASQAMMGGDVDPFETFEHRDCEKCGHLLQCHVGFETWQDVQLEHDQWCPGARA